MLGAQGRRIVDWKRFRITALSFVFLFLGSLVGSGLGAAVFWLGIYRHAATAIVGLGMLGGCAGFAIGVLFGGDLLSEEPDKRLWLVFDVLIAAVGLGLVVRGLLVHSPGQVVDGFIGIVAAAAWFARNKRGVFPAAVCLLAAAAFAALAIINRNPLWFAVTTFSGLGAVGYYVHPPRQRTRAVRRLTIAPGAG